MARRRIAVEVWFRETPRFTASLSTYFGGDEPLRLLQLVLARDPEAGTVIPGCGGIRKFRWPDPRRSKGKRGGLRVIYLHVPMANHILLMDVYDKDEADDLSADDKHSLRKLADEYRREIAAELERRR